MKLKGLLIACAVLAALLGALYWSNHHPSDAKSSTKAAGDAVPKILSFAPADVTGLTILRKDEPAVKLTRNSAGVWQITSPQPLAADQDSVGSVLSTLSSLNAERLLEDKTSNLASYGLGAPALEVEITLKTNPSKKLVFGDQTPSGNAFYTMLEGDPRLFTVANYNKSSLDKSAEDLRDKRLLAADFDKVTQIELITQRGGARQDITLGRSKDSWQIVKPGPFRAGPDSVEDLIRSLKDAKMETGSAAEAGAAAAAFQSATPVAEAKITGASGTQELEVRKAKDQYYAKSTVVPGIFQVPATLGSDLNQSLDDLRNKKLFDFGFQVPNKIEVHEGSKSYLLTRSGPDWWDPDGKKLDRGKVEDLVGAVRDLQATKFPTSGFAPPTLSITVVHNDGKTIEQVAVAKRGDSYIAKRDTEAALYELTASSIASVQTALANLQRAAPAPTK